MKAVLHNKYFWLIFLLHLITAEGKAQSSFIKKLPLRGVPAKMIATSDGGYACLAATDFVNFQFNKISLIKCDANGDTTWMKKYALNDSSVYFPDDFVETLNGYVILSRCREFSESYIKSIIYFTDLMGNVINSIVNTDPNGIANWSLKSIPLSLDSIVIMGGASPNLFLKSYNSTGSLLFVNTNDTFAYPFQYTQMYSKLNKTTNVDLHITKVQTNITKAQNIYTSNNGILHNNDHYYSGILGLFSDINKLDNSLAYLKYNGDTIIKLDNNLDSLWAHTVTNYYTAGFTSQLPKDFKATADGGYVLCGNISNVIAHLVFLLKTDSLANTVFKQIYFGAMADNVVSVEQAADGGFVMLQSGNADSTNVPEMWLVKTDSTGVLTNVKNPALQPAQPDFTLSPNPAGSYTQLVFNKAVTGKVTVYDLAGKALFTAEIKNKPTFRLKLDSCNSGLYIIRFMPKSGLPVSKKLIINH